METKSRKTVDCCAVTSFKKKIMGNVTVFVVFLIFIVVYMVLGSLKIKDKMEIPKEQIPTPKFDFEFEGKAEGKSAKNVGSPAYKQRIIENFEKRFSQVKSDVRRDHFSKERESIQKEKNYNFQPESHTHKISNSYMENFSLKKAVVYSEILKRKF